MKEARWSPTSWAAAALSALLGAAPAAAQVQTGSLLVHVSDESGAAAPGAAVTIASPVLVAGQMTGATDSRGTYRFPSLPPGAYTLRVELGGFRSLVRENLAVLVGQTTPVELALKVAGQEETMTVTAESPAVDTTSANVSVTLDTTLLQKTPGGRDIWSLVEYKVPGLITSRPDVGGAAGGLQGAMIARGTPNGQNAQFLNGINVGDPAAIGFTQFYYDYEAFDQIQVSTGAHDLSVPSGGVFLNMVTKTGTDRFSGKVSGFWQSDGTQTQNVDQDLRRFGFRDDAGAVDHISDANFQIGGPIVKDKLRFFTSFRDWRVHVNVPGFPEVEETNITSGIANITWQLDQHNRVTAFASRQYYKKPNRGASALFTPESVFSEDDVTAIYQALWNSVLSDHAFMDARVSYNDLFFPLYQKGAEQTLLDLSTNLRTRAAAQEQLFTRRRLQASVNLQYFVDHALGGRHELRFGVDHAHAPTKTTVNRIDDLNLSYRSAPTAAASTVELFNSPVFSQATVDVTALFAQDTFQVKNLTVTAGARLERVEGYLPAQDSPPSRWFPTANRSFEAIHGIPKWYTVAPRVGLAYDLGGRGRTALKAAAGRYYYTIGTGTPNSVNPNFNFSEVYAWSDRNGDLRFQAGEQGALQSRTGGLITSLDPDLARPHTDELTAGVDHELLPGLRLSVVFTARRERDNFGNHDVGVPESAFRPVTRVDAGRDGLAGTADDAALTVFDQDPATRGQNRIVVTNNPLYDQDHRSLEITATKRFNQRWQVLAGYTWQKTEQDLDTSVRARTATNPNDKINASGPILFDRTHLLKLTGSYTMPRGFELSANFRAQTGAPITRTVTFSGLTQGNVTVNAEPQGSQRLDALTTLDARLAKVFKFNGTRELEATLDGYNLLNAATVWDVRTLTGRINVREGGDPTSALINQQQFLSPLGFIGPRIFRLGLSYRF
ncbi:MAG TPA: TonB-dependent receptor [Vicinamibacteria bacterium]